MSLADPKRQPIEIEANRETEDLCEDPHELVAPLAEGSLLEGWTVQRIMPIERGALSIVLLDSVGAEFQLDVCARDPLHDPLARTDLFDVYLVNGGDGATATREDQGLAALALAGVIRSNEHFVDRTGFTTLTVRLACGDARRHTSR